MKVLLENIGAILDNAPNEEVKSYARTLLSRIANNDKNILSFYLELLVKYINAMDPGAEWNKYEILGEMSKEWINFDKRYLGPDIYLPNNKVCDSRPEFFESQLTPLFLEENNGDHED